jgi:hypothetical protein
MNEHDKIRLQLERDKLDRLVDEALENGTPISQAYEVIEQSKKVQELMLMFDSENEESD